MAGTWVLSRDVASCPLIRSVWTETDHWSRFLQIVANMILMLAADRPFKNTLLEWEMWHECFNSRCHQTCWNSISRIVRLSPLHFRVLRSKGSRKVWWYSCIRPYLQANQTPLPVRFFVPMPSLFVCFCVSFALAQVRSVLKCSLDTSCLRILETFIATSCPSADLKQFSNFFSYLDWELVNNWRQIQRWNCVILWPLVAGIFLLEQICSRNIQLGYRTACRRKPWHLQWSHQRWMLSKQQSFQALSAMV